MLIVSFYIRDNFLEPNPREYWGLLVYRKYDKNLSIHLLIYFEANSLFITSNEQQKKLWICCFDASNLISSSILILRSYFLSCFTSQSNCGSGAVIGNGINFGGIRVSLGAESFMVVYSVFAAEVFLWRRWRRQWFYF